MSCGALGLHYLVRSKRKTVSILAVIVVAALIAPVLPVEFWDRMRTIQVAAQDLDRADTSTVSRVHFWNVAIVMANTHPLTGVGHNAYNVFYDRYDSSEGEYGRGRSVHNSWLGVFAELGYPGLVMFVLLVGFAFRACWRAHRLAKRDPTLQHFGRYATAIEAALVVFAFGGSFVPWQYCEMLWHMLALSAVLNQLVTEKEAATAAAPLATSPATAAAIALRAISHTRNQARA